MSVGYRKLQHEAFVDPKRMGVYGYSRGAMAASLLVVADLDDAKAAVFGAGIYDFKRAYDDSTLRGVRENMKAETGMTKEAIRERSSILRMENLKCPVLILHGEDDKNVPVSQAKLLRDRLTALHKDFEIHLFPGREHSIGPEVPALTLDFFQRKLSEQFDASREMPRLWARSWYRRARGLDLVMSPDMPFQSLHRQVLLNCPEPHHQSGRRDRPANDQVNVHVPLGVGS